MLQQRMRAGMCVHCQVHLHAFPGTCDPVLSQGGVMKDWRVRAQAQDCRPDYTWPPLLLGLHVSSDLEFSAGHCTTD